IAAYLVRQPLDSERRIRKILALLQRYGQPEAYALVCRSVARQRLDRGLYGPAIAYYMRANEPRRVAHIADELLLNYIRTGDLGQYTPIIDNLGPQNQLFSDHLQFLSQYRDFHEHSQRKEWVKAGQVLVGLLTTQVAPKKFWFIMLVDAIPLLEGDELVLNSQDTSELMRCLEEITSSHLNQQYLQLTSPLWLKSKDKSIANGRIPIDQQLEIVRMTLVRNLARSLL
ncbi:Nup85 nucleoporin-domain-containing protein, partial [Dimargaris cristalligena]